MSRSVKRLDESSKRGERLSRFASEHPTLMFAAGGVVYISIGLVLLALLHMYINPTTSTQKKDLIQALGFILAGTAGGIGIYFTWRNLTQTQETLRVTQEGQITERFTRAIDQLGASKEGKEPPLEVRLGGIYALERIARDSTRQEDHWTVMEVMTAFIRGHTPWLPKSPEDKLFERLDLPAFGTRRPACQAILTVIGRRSEAHRKIETGTLDLLETDLRFADIRDAHLEKANLYRTRLEGSDLTNSHLNEAYLYEAHLEGADLTDANLAEADLTGAHLENATLRGAHLEGAELSDAHLDGADLRGAHLREATIFNTSLEGADVRGADLRVGETTTLDSAQLRRMAGDHATQLLDSVTAPAWWDRCMPKDDLLSPGEYATPTFRPALTLNIPDFDWWASDDNPWQVSIQNIGKTSRITRYGDWVLNFFNARALQVYDATNPNTGQPAPLFQDMISWLQQHPCFSTEDPVPVTIGDASGTQLNINVTSVPDEQPRNIATPGVRVFRYGPPLNFYAFNAGFKYQFTELDSVEEETVFIVVESPADDFDELILRTRQLLATVKWGL